METRISQLVRATTLAKKSISTHLSLKHNSSMNPSICFKTKWDLLEKAESSKVHSTSSSSQLLGKVIRQWDLQASMSSEISFQLPLIL